MFYVKIKSQNEFMKSSIFQNSNKNTVRDHSSIMSSNFQKMAIFDDLQYSKSPKRWVGGPKKVKNMMT